MLFESGVKLFEHQEFTEAIYIFKQVLQHENDTEHKIGACYYLAIMYKNIDEEQRRYYLLKAMEYDRKRPEICCELGLYYTDRQQFRQAIPLFLSAIKRERPSSEAFFIRKDYWDYIPYLQLSVCYDRLKETRKAYVYNELAGVIYPNSQSVRYNRNYYTRALANELAGGIEAEKKRIVERRHHYRDVQMDGVSIITVTNKRKYMDMIFTNYNRMKYPKKEMILILNSNELNIEEYKERAKEKSNIHVYQLEEEVTLGECLNYGIEKSAYEYIAKIDDDDFYGENYLLDDVIDSKEYNIDVIVKSVRLIFFEQDQTLRKYRGLGENTVVLGGAGGTIFAKKSVFNRLRFQAVNVAEDEAFFQECRRLGIMIYSGSRFNYIYNRHCLAADHTFVVADQHFKKDCIPIEGVISAEEYAIV